MTQAEREQEAVHHRACLDDAERMVMSAYWAALQEADAVGASFSDADEEELMRRIRRAFKLRSAELLKQNAARAVNAACGLPADGSVLRLYRDEPPEGGGAGA